MIKCFTRPKTHIYCAVLTMVASNANSDRPAINYSHLLTKLKAELPESTPKKSCSAKRFYPTETQRWLLDVCGYKFFLNSPGFDTVKEVNQFVTEHAKYRKKNWEDTWWHAMSRYALHIMHILIVFNTYCIMYCLVNFIIFFTELCCFFSYTYHYHCNFLNTSSS